MFQPLENGRDIFDRIYWIDGINPENSLSMAVPVMGIWTPVGVPERIPPWIPPWAPGAIGPPGIPGIRLIPL